MFATKTCYEAGKPEQHMGLATNIMRRGGDSKNYYVRIYLPQDLQKHYGKKEIWKSLKTSDQREAKRLARIVLTQWETEFEVLRSRRILSDHELQAAIWNRFSTLVRNDETRRQSLPNADDLSDIWQVLVAEFGDQDVSAWRILEEIATSHEGNAAQREKRLATLKEEIARGETKSVSTLVAEVIDARKLAIDPRSSDSRKLAHGLQRAEIAGLNVIAQRDRGDFAATSTDPLVAPPTATAPLVAAPGESIMELFEKYASRNLNDISKETLNQSRTVMGLFSEFVGSTFPASAINKKHVREWLDCLHEYPVKATEIKEFKGLKIREVIHANQKVGKPTISRSTINRYLAALGAFSKFLVRQGFLESNPAEGLYAKKEKEQRVFPYSTEQLQGIFRSPLYVGFKQDGKEHKPGKQTTRDHRFWLPFLSLFSGARLGELCQLLSSDVHEQHGVWIIWISAEGDKSKRLKTKGSQRVVPIHPELIKLGFIEYVKAKQAANSKWLFPEIEPDTRGTRVGTYSGFYRRYIARIGVKEDKTINFHSYRHGFADALRDAGFLDHNFKFVLGHTQNSVTGRYGRLLEGDLETRTKIVSSVRYKDLDLTHLYP